MGGGGGGGGGGMVRGESREHGREGNGGSERDRGEQEGGVENEVQKLQKEQFKEH